MKDKEKLIDIGKNVGIENNSVKLITDYYATKALHKITIDDGQRKVSSMSKLFEARWLQDIAGQDLENKRNEVLNHDSQLNISWNKLSEQQKLLRESFLKYNNFIFENNNKEKRLNKSNQREKEKQHYLTAKTKCTLLKNVSENKTKDKLNKELQKFDIYRQPLDRVVEKSGNISDIAELIKRFQILQNILSELVKLHVDSLLAITGEKHCIDNEYVQQESKLMALNTQLTDIQNRIVKAQSQFTKWDVNLAKMDAYAHKKSVEISKVKLGVWTLYKIICKRNNEIGCLREVETEEQLLFITNEIKKLRKLHDAVLKTNNINLFTD